MAHGLIHTSRIGVVGAAVGGISKETLAACDLCSVSNRVVVKRVQDLVTGVLGFGDRSLAASKRNVGACGIDGLILIRSSGSSSTEKVPRAVSAAVTSG